MFPLTRKEQFFFDHAGYSWNPEQESEMEGRARCATAMASAERYAWEQDWAFEWSYDIDGCIGCDCGSEECACSTGTPHEVLVCELINDDREHLTSLGGICGPTADYRRVIEAELALEAMSREVRTSD